MNKSIYPTHRRAIGITVAAALLSLAACERKTVPACGDPGAAACTPGGQAPSAQDHGAEQQK